MAIWAGAERGAKAPRHAGACGIAVGRPSRYTFQGKSRLNVPLICRRESARTSVRRAKQSREDCKCCHGRAHVHIYRDGHRHDAMLCQMPCCVIWRDSKLQFEGLRLLLHGVGRGSSRAHDCKPLPRSSSTREVACASRQAVMAMELMLGRDR